jgi:hypothetical protein
MLREETTLSGCDTPRSQVMANIERSMEYSEIMKRTPSTVS